MWVARSRLIEWLFNGTGLFPRIVWFMWFAWALFILSGCGASGVTSSTETGTPNEELAVSLAQCHGKHHQLGEIEVVFHDSVRGDGAKGWAFPRSDTIHLARPFVNGTDRVSLEMVVAHEVCHCAGVVGEGHWDGDNWIPGVTDFCAQLAYRDAGCQS
jgi:hypothetical protein